MEALVYILVWSAILAVGCIFEKAMLALNPIDKSKKFH